MKTEILRYLKTNFTGIGYKFIVGSVVHLTLISVIDILETHLPLAAYTGVF